MIRLIAYLCISIIKIIFSENMKNKEILSIQLLKRILIISLIIISPLFGANGPEGTIAWSMMIMTLLGGLALFLYGMNKMSDGMKKAAGDSMRKILAAITKNRLLGLIIGAFVTMVIQSSSATTVMLVSFVQAKLMTYVQSIGIILGANIGTTVTAQLIAFKFTDYALAMIAVGFILSVFAFHCKLFFTIFSTLLCIIPFDAI